MRTTLRLITALTLSLLTGAVLAGESSAITTATLISQGELQLQNNDIDGAIATLTKAIEQEPNSSLAHTRLGGAYLLGQRYDNAIGQFQQAIGLDANNASAFIGMGIAYLHSNRLGAAKAALGEGKRLAPDTANQIDDLINRVEQRSGVPPHQ
ncbi:MAG: tetratricopeptide repeat protein [Thiohalocapsa sp.]